VFNVPARFATMSPATLHTSNATRSPIVAVGTLTAPHIAPSDAANLKSPPPNLQATAIMNNGTDQIAAPTNAVVNLASSVNDAPPPTGV
jgi:hypothetical protein